MLNSYKWVWDEITANQYKKIQKSWIKSEHPVLGIKFSTCTFQEERGVSGWLGVRCTSLIEILGENQFRPHQS